MIEPISIRDENILFEYAPDFDLVSVYFYKPNAKRPYQSRHYDLANTPKKYQKYMELVVTK